MKKNIKNEIQLILFQTAQLVHFRWTVMSSVDLSTVQKPSVPCLSWTRRKLHLSWLRLCWNTLKLWKYQALCWSSFQAGTSSILCRNTWRWIHTSVFNFNTNFATIFSNFFIFYFKLLSTNLSMLCPCKVATNIESCPFTLKSQGKNRDECLSLCLTVWLRSVKVISAFWQLINENFLFKQFLLCTTGHFVHQHRWDQHHHQWCGLRPRLLQVRNIYIKCAVCRIPKPIIFCSISEMYS